MTETLKATDTDLRNEIMNCNLALKAFKIGCPHLAPDDLGDTSLAWVEMQKRACIRILATRKAAK